MTARTLSGPAAQQNLRSGNRLGVEIYVASEASATPLQSYAPQSNFLAPQCVSLPWTPGIQVLSSPEFPLPTKACAAAIRLNGGSSPSTSFQTDFHHDARRSFSYGQCDPCPGDGRRREG